MFYTKRVRKRPVKQSEIVSASRPLIYDFNFYSCILTDKDKPWWAYFEKSSSLLPTETPAAPSSALPRLLYATTHDAAPSPAPVSYTHLDVYKRQDRDRWTAGCVAAGSRSDPERTGNPSCGEAETGIGQRCQKSVQLRLSERYTGRAEQFLQDRSGCDNDAYEIWLLQSHECV